MSLPARVIARSCSTIVVAIGIGVFMFQSGVVLAQDANSGEGTKGDDSEEGFVAIFDGKSLENWSGSDELWSVVDGAITGTTTTETGLKKNQFLTWTGGELEDFELRLKFKIADGNSGIQFRSKSVGEADEFRVHGYQADIDSKMRYMGILYEEGGRGILAERSKKVEITADGKKKEVGTTGDDEKIVEAINAAGWNDYVIRVQGNHIVQSINGQVCVDVTDHQESAAAKSGILALQIHVGPPMVVQFKDIRLKSLGE